MTDLVERYISAIRSELPDAQKQDVVAELRDVLLSQVEDREAELGRPLTRDEAADLLHAFGNPLVVASRYRRFNHLIGPEVFPFYWFGLKALLGIAVILHVVVGVVLIAAAAEPGQALGQLISRILATAIGIVGWTTLAFVVIEHTGAARSLGRWDPRRLPPAVSDRRKSPFDLTLDLAFTVLFVAWWVGLVNWQEWGLIADRRGGLEISAGPMREALHWPVLTVALASLPITAMELLRPHWHRIAAGLELTWSLVALGLLVAYAQGEPLVQVAGELPADQLARSARGVGFAVRIGLAALAALIAWDAARAAWWLYRGAAGRREPSAAGD